MTINTEKEQARIKALYLYNLLDTPPDGSFDKLTQLAAKFFNMPIVLITLVDKDRIWFKSKYGIKGITQINRDPGLCASAILSDEIYIVEDARNDPRTLANPLVAGEFGLQFYAAANLQNFEGYNLGTFCLLDKNKRYLNIDQQNTLQLFADVVMESIEFRRIAHNTINELKSKLEKFQSRIA